MSLLTERDLSAELKRGRRAPVYLFYGEETYLTRLYIQRLIRQSVTDLPEMNVHSFEGAASFDEIVVALDTLPLMSEKTCVVLRDFPLTAPSDAEWKQLLARVKEPNECAVLIFAWTGEEIGRSKRAKELTDAVSAVGSVVEFTRKSERELAEIAARRAAKRQIVLPPAAANRLIERCGVDLENLLTEVDKLCAYVGEGAASPADVDAITTRTIEASAFALAGAVCSRRRDEAMAICDDLFALRTEPVMILGALSSVFLDIYRVKLGEASGMRSERLAEELGYGRAAFKLRNAATNGRRMSTASAYEALEILRQADLALKSTSADGRVVIERTLVRLMKVAAGENE